MLDMRATVVLGQVGAEEPNARTCLEWFGRELGEQSPRPTLVAIPNNPNIFGIATGVTSETFSLGSRSNHPKQARAMDPPTPTCPRTTVVRMWGDAMAHSPP